MNLNSISENAINASASALDINMISCVASFPFFRM